LEHQVAQNTIIVVLDQSVDEALIDHEKPDAVILATGALPTKPPIPGVDLPHVVQAWDVLQDKVITGRRVVIIGGGAVGVETALFLGQKGTLSAEAVKFLLINRAEDPNDLYRMAIKGTKEIVVIDMIDKMGGDIGKTTRWGIFQDLHRHGIRTKTTTEALQITATGVKIETNGKVEEIPADTVVLAAGAASYNPLQEFVDKQGIPCKVIGDAARVALAFDAVHQGFEAGRTI
jgi:2,4-dienoyl-CoA reductase (NADPH2)